MRCTLICILAGPLFTAGQLLAQEPPANDTPPRDAPTPTKTPAPTANGGAAADAGAASKPAATDAGAAGKPAATDASKPPENIPPFHGWVRAEYLFLWMRNAPLPVPIVTTGDPRVGFDPNNANTVNTAGAIGQPGTRVLFGDQGVRFGPFAGGQLGFGIWFDDEEIFGVDGSGFFIGRLTQNFSLTSNQPNGLPLYFPIFSSIAGAERAIPISDPLRGFSGDVGVHSSLRLWGAEGNGVLALVRNSNWEWTTLTGFRYADLLEHLLIDNTTTDLAFGNVMSLSEVFGTRNQFYGGQLGSRLAAQFGCFSIDATGKVALGFTHEVENVVGSITQLGPNPLIPPGPGTFPGGIFTQPSNIGHRTADPFAVLSSLELRFGYNLTPRARVFAGYDVLYWNDVVRPGNQVSHAVNLTQNAVLDPNGAGVLVGPAQPAPLFIRSAFWAQGLTFGLDVRF